MENRKVKWVLSGGWHQWEGEDIRKGCRRWIWWKYYILCMKMKKETCCNYSKNRRRRNKGERWRGWIQFWYIVRTFVNVTMYPHTTVRKKKKEKEQSSVRIRGHRRMGVWREVYMQGCVHVCPCVMRVVCVHTCRYGCVCRGVSVCFFFYDIKYMQANNRNKINNFTIVITIYRSALQLN
jgi:hypothetical protein